MQNDREHQRNILVEILESEEFKNLSLAAKDIYLETLERASVIRDDIRQLRNYIKNLIANHDQQEELGVTYGHQGKFVGNIEELTINNSYFRKVINTTINQQLVVMSIKPGEDIGMEVHQDSDQFFRIEAGSGSVIMDGYESLFENGFAIMVPKGTHHNKINTGPIDLKLYTIYSFPNHPYDSLQKTKADAMAAE